MRTEEAARTEAGYRSLFQRIPVPLYRSTPQGELLAVNPAMVEMLAYPNADSLLEGSAGDIYVDPEDRSRLQQALERDGEVVGFEARLRRRDGTVIWTRDSVRAVSDEDGQVMYLEGAMTDVTDETVAEQQLRRQARELAALHDTTFGLIEQLDVNGVLDAILSQAAGLLGTEHAYLYVVDGDELVLRAGTGLFVDFVGYRLPRGKGLAGRVWATGEPYAVDDYQAWEGRRPEFSFIRAAAAVPLRTGSEVTGVIGLVHTEDHRRFGAMEMGIVSRFGRMASLALTNAGLYEAVQRELAERRRAEEERRRLLGALVRVQEEERRRIATEIHDDPVQAMTAVEMRLESLRRRVEGEEERGALANMSSAVSSAIGRLRHLLVELRPSGLDREGLASALRGLLDRLHGETGVDVHLEDRSLHEIPPATRTVLYRIAQEALVNVRKHAHARRVQVVVAERDGGITMRVRDDGRGFDPARTSAEPPGHIGLVSMRERAELAGGRFKVTSVPSAGTTVDVWVPSEVGDG